MTTRFSQLQIVIVFAIILLGSILRFYSLSSLPRSPYWEEVAVAYDAYSLLQTGHDHHGNFLPIVALESFGDWKPAGYAYAQIPSIAIFGMNVFSLRFPAAVSGVSLIVLAGLVSWKLTNSRWSAMLAMGLTATSSWQILFSRAGWEVMLATALFTWGAACIVYAVLERPKYSGVFSLLGCLVLGSSAYTYHAMRLLVPFFLVSISVYAIVTTYFGNDKEKILTFRNIAILFVCSVVLFIPFLRVWGSPQLGQRFAETSIFSDIQIIQRSNEAISLGNNTVAARLFNHRYIEYALVLASNYLSHFSPGFLFVKGDENPRHATGYGGQLYLLDAGLLLAGGLALTKRVQHRNSSRHWVFFVGCLLLLSPIPASLTQATPHALRTVPMSLGLLIVASVGGYHILEVATKIHPKPVVQWLTIATAVLIYSFQPIAWWRHYTSVYSVTAASEWQYGYKQLYEQLAILSEKNPNSKIYVSRRYGRPAMYFWFYSKTNPHAVQEANSVVRKDQGEYLEFGYYRYFTGLSEISFGPMIIAIPPDQLSEVLSQSTSMRIATTVQNLQGEEIWYILVDSGN